MHATSKEGRQKNPHGVQGVRNNLGIQLKNATGSTYHKETLCTRTTHMLQQSCNNLILLLWKCGKDEDGSAQQRAPFEGQLLLRDSNVHSWQCSIYCVGRRCMHSYRACRRLRQRQEALWAPAQREEKIFTRMVALKERKKKKGSLFGCLFGRQENGARSNVHSPQETKKKLHRTPCITGIDFFSIDFVRQPWE